MERIVLLLGLVVLAGCNAEAMSTLELEADPCGAFIGNTWTVKEHPQGGGHEPSDFQLLAPIGMQFEINGLPAIVVQEGPQENTPVLQAFWSSFNSDLECNVSYKNGFTFNRMEARGEVSAGGTPHPHYFTMVSQTCASGKLLFTGWITDERPDIEPSPGPGASSLCPGEDVYPNLDTVAVAKTHNGRVHGDGDGD